MGHCIQMITINTSMLPETDLRFQKLFPIIKKRIEDRCKAICIENGEPEAFEIKFLVDQSVPAEGFCLEENGKNGIIIKGADFLALMYGSGQLLHKSTYTSDGFVPTSWRGLSVPQSRKRMIFFAQHFHNWYQRCTAEEIREHIEDLTLWGINGVVSVFSCLNLTGWDDPGLSELVALFHKTLGAARELGLKIGIEYSNVDFMIPRPDIRADKKYLLSQTGNLICPSTEKGFAYYQQMLEKILDYTDVLGGLDFITLWSYDEGGCCCDKCWPWGGRGFYNMAHRISKYIRGRYPHIEIWLATWYLGRRPEQAEEWPMLYQRLQEDAAKGDTWVDYLLLETRDDYPAVFYPAEHGQPTEHTKLLTFPDVSMTGITPWGGFGAICTPRLMRRQEQPFARHCDGGYLYTEGIFDDINKVYNLNLYWDRNRTDREILTDYCNYEYEGIKPDDFIQLIGYIESGHLCTNRFDRRPADLADCDGAWELAQKMNESASQRTEKYWRWRILYIRAYLDKVRYHRCAELGWPLRKTPAGWMHYWRKFLEHDQKAQEYLLELIHLYKAHELDDPDKYAYHWYVRPPMTRGADLEFERRNQETML